MQNLINGVQEVDSTNKKLNLGSGHFGNCGECGCRT